MTSKELAAKLDGHEYRTDFPEKLMKQAKKEGLVVVYGFSDDLMEIEGALNDEAGCWGGREIKIDANGLIPSKDDMEDEEEDDVLQEWLTRRKAAKKIEAVWFDKKKNAAWSFKTKIPHETFKVLDKENSPATIQCIGIVFDIKELN